MQKAKVALVEAGIIKAAGRGRISAEGHAWLKQQHDNGVRFSDWPKGEITVTKSEASADKPAETKVRVIRDKTPDANSVAELAPYRYTEEEFKAVEKGTKIERSLRCACNNCRVSLVVCYCEKPRITARDGGGSVEVTIVRK